MDILIFTMHRTTDERFYFNIKDTFGRKMLTSKNYLSTADCLCDIYRIRQYGNFTLTDEPQVESCQYRFRLASAAGCIIAKSVVYYSEAELEQDKATIHAFISAAAVEDHSSAVRFFRPVNNSGN